MQAERALISRVLVTGRVKAAIQSGIEPHFFHKHRPEWEFLVKWYLKHNEAPDAKVFCERFPDFRLQKQTRKSVKIRPAVEAVVDNHIAIELAHSLEAAVTALDEKPASEILEEHLQRLAKISRIQDGDEDIDIIADALTDVAEFERLQRGQMDDEHFAVIPTPWEPVNEYFGGGWRDGELIGIVAGPNEGKSWLATQAAVFAALSGARPYVAPLEMNRYEVVTRIHTIASYYLSMKKKGKKSKRLSKLRLPALIDHKTIRETMEGRRIFRNQMLLMGHNTIDIDNYRDWAGNLSKHMPQGIILPDLRSRSTAFTLSTFISKVERSEADIAFLDYLGLLQDMPRGMQRWEMWADLTKNLKIAAQRLNIPIIVCLQSGKSGAANKTPEMEDIADSYAIARDCDRILSVRQRDVEMFVTCIKNRQGLKHWRMPCHFFPDFGVIEYNRDKGVDEDVM